MYVCVCVYDVCVCVYDVCVCVCEVKSATRKLLTGESKLFFLTDLKRKRNAQITVCYDVERRKIQVSMYKTNYKSFLSLSCLPVCSHNFLLLFFRFFFLLRSSFLRISSRTRAEKRSIRHPTILCYANRRYVQS